MFGGMGTQSTLLPHLPSPPDPPPPLGLCAFPSHLLGKVCNYHSSYGPRSPSMKPIVPMCVDLDLCSVPYFSLAMSPAHSLVQSCPGSLPCPSSCLSPYPQSFRLSSSLSCPLFWIFTLSLSSAMYPVLSPAFPCPGSPPCLVTYSIACPGYLPRLSRLSCPLSSLSV
jgi:hypothetical protein